jgi:hypothetical protein
MKYIKLIGSKYFNTETSQIVDMTDLILKKNNLETEIEASRLRLENEIAIVDAQIEDIINNN